MLILGLIHPKTGSGEAVQRLFFGHDFNAGEKFVERGIGGFGADVAHRPVFRKSVSVWFRFDRGAAR